MPAAKTQPAPKNYGGGWKAKNKSVDLQCPSGEWCKVRKPSLQGLLEAGVLQSVDQLTGIVETEVIPKAKANSAPKTVAPESLMEDPEKMQSVFDMIDRVVVYVVLEPTILPKPANPADRDPDAIYSDDVDLEDKMHIMEHALSGVSDLGSFRPEA